MDAHEAPVSRQAAADRCLTVLSYLRSRVGDRTGYAVKAVNLCRHIFPREAYAKWCHETRRRRVREAVDVARDQLRQDGRGVQIAGSGAGYWMTGDAGELKRYADRRRRSGLQQLAAAKEPMKAIQAIGQASLFDKEFPHA